MDTLDPGEARFRLLVESVQDYAIFLLDPDGLVLTWNAGAQRLKQYQAHEIVGRSFELFYPQEALDSRWPQQELERAAALGRFEDEGWRVRQDGSRFWANVVLTALRGPDGVLQGFAKVTRDLTERREHEELLRRSEEQFRLLLESVSDYAIFMLDPQGLVLTWNTGAQAIKGYSASQVLGRHFSMFYTEEDRQANAPALELATALQTGRSESEGWRVRSGGSRFWANAVITPIMDPGGTLRGYAKVTRDLTEQRRMADVERSSQRIQEFIAMLAHELRNPLAPIRNAASILQLQAGLPPAVARAGTIIDRQLGHMTRLVDDLLDVGRIITGKIALQRANIDYRDVVHLSVEALHPMMNERRHQLLVDLPDAPLKVNGDMTRLSQALQNLLQNAARYTPEGGRIQLQAVVDGATIRVEVSDNGIGIAPEARERIFELFVQERAAQPETDGVVSLSGLGIGLSLARTLVEQHGGSVSAHSDGPGRGSRFTLILPALPPQQAAAATPPPADKEAAPGHRVLVVDDNRDSTDTMVELLNLFGHEAQGAYGADSGVATAARFKPRLVLLDLNMPDGDGFSAMKRMRAQAEGPMCIVAMTGYGQQTDRARTKAAGFDHHLTKPVGPDQLQQALDLASQMPRG